RVYTDPDLYAREQERIFRGPTWSFLALDCEIPNPGDYKTTYVGDAPVVVARAQDGSVNAMVNRCAHKGAPVCYKRRGNVCEFNDAQHNCPHDLAGSLTGGGVGKGVGGKGGLPADFRQEQHGLEKLCVETHRGLIFGEFPEEPPPFAAYVGADLAAN